jgi:hypothetical protein
MVARLDAVMKCCLMKRQNNAYEEWKVRENLVDFAIRNYHIIFIMDPVKQRAAIAEYCGWKDVRGHMGIPPENGMLFPYPEHHEEDWRLKPFRGLPDYLNDLNAMHEAEKSLEDKDENGRLMAEYASWKLSSVCEIYSPKNELVHAYAGSIGNYLLVHATAAQRAEAFLKTIGKWEE